ncbi:MAG: hypothetical protein SF162_00615 [bacterium]|nr:hypothetical protein [bacterium]
MRIRTILILVGICAAALCIGLAGTRTQAQDDLPDLMPTATRTAPRPGAETTAAATAEPTPVRLRAEVQVESAFVRALPLLEAEAVASVFEDEILEVVGRNLDGLWFEVRRPGRMNTLGWIFYEMLDWDFETVDLPLTDLATGAVGESPLTADPGYAVYLLENARLRPQPRVSGDPIGIVAINSTVPVIYRNQDGSWYYVNYLGTEGWISNYSTRELPLDFVLTIPVQPGLPPLAGINVVIIPPEVQLEQVERLRAYVQPRLDLARQLAQFWFLVNRGETMPCEAPPFVQEFLLSVQDVRELPELQRYVPGLEQGAFSLNTAIELLTVCGAFRSDVVATARNAAINATGRYEAALISADNIESIIRQYE